MGHYVHIHLAFACDDHAPLARIAQRHLDAGTATESTDAVRFLRGLTERNYVTIGPKGGLCTWGHVGNYTDGEEFCEALRGFWRDLFDSGRHEDGDDECGFHDHERIVVFVEHEQTERAEAYEIRCDRGYDELIRPQDIVISKHECTFAWLQM